LICKKFGSELWEMTVHALIGNAGMHNILEKRSAKLCQ